MGSDELLVSAGESWSWQDITVNRKADKSKQQTYPSSIFFS